MRQESKPTIEQVLKLVEQLTPSERAQLMKQMQLDVVRQSLDRAEQDVAEGKVLPADQVIAELRARAKERGEKQQ